MDILSGLLGQRAPEFMTAAGFSDSPHFMYSGKYSCSVSIESDNDMIISHRVQGGWRMVPAVLDRFWR